MTRILSVKRVTRSWESFNRCNPGESAFLVDLGSLGVPPAACYYGVLQLSHKVTCTLWLIYIYSSRQIDGALPGLSDTRKGDGGVTKRRACIIAQRFAEY